MNTQNYSKTILIIIIGLSGYLLFSPFYYSLFPILFFAGSILLSNLYPMLNFWCWLVDPFEADYSQSSKSVVVFMAFSTISFIWFFVLFTCKTLFHFITL